MAKVFYLHWHQEEIKPRIAALKAAGHEVQYHSSTEDHIKLGDLVPDVVVISLDRLPSHGCHVAEWFWEAKKRQSIPLVFAGGKPDKAAEVKRKFPKAIFCATDDILDVLKRVSSNSTK
jgi:hypothetical protein